MFYNKNVLINKNTKKYHLLNTWYLITNSGFTVELSGLDQHIKMFDKQFAIKQ